MTLCIIRKDGKVLLGMKKRGFGAGRWNGFGGKVLEGETIEEAAKREIVEESEIIVKDLELIGILDFRFQKNMDEILRVHIFRSTSFEGEPRETEEMLPQWFDEKEIPFEKMWPDDVHWFPLFLADKKFEGKFTFDDSDQILEKELIEKTA